MTAMYKRDLTGKKKCSESETFRDAYGWMDGWIRLKQDLHRQDDVIITATVCSRQISLVRKMKKKKEDNDKEFQTALANWGLGVLVNVFDNRSVKVGQSVYLPQNDTRVLEWRFFESKSIRILD